jgi:hypothetical protein
MVVIMTSVYVFSRVHPPLMKDYGGDIYSVPNEQLQNLIGTAKWTTEKPDNCSPVHVKGQVLETQFELTRNVYWSLLLPPEHFSEDITMTVTVISGASEVKKHSMERGLEASAGASGFGLSTSVKATLKITDETTREWHSERKEQREQLFKAGYTYCTWILTDELLLKKTTQSKLAGKPSPINPRIVVSNSDFSCVLGTYQDKWLDTESREISAEEMKLLAAAAPPMSVVVTLPSGKLV